MIASTTPIVPAGTGARLGHHALLRHFAAGLQRKTHGEFAAAAELLNLDLAEAEGVRGLADMGDVGLAVLGLHLHQRAAAEIDAEIEPDGDE